MAQRRVALALQIDKQVRRWRLAPGHPGVPCSTLECLGVPTEMANPQAAGRAAMHPTRRTGASAVQMMYGTREKSRQEWMVAKVREPATAPPLCFASVQADRRGCALR